MGRSAILRRKEVRSGLRRLYGQGQLPTEALQEVDHADFRSGHHSVSVNVHKGREGHHHSQP